MEITDEFYSNVNDGEIQARIGGLNKQSQNREDNEIKLFREYVDWKRNWINLTE
jgi:hypothetical protein